MAEPDFSGPVTRFSTRYGGASAVDFHHNFPFHPGRGPSTDNETQNTNPTQPVNGSRNIFGR